MGQKINPILFRIGINKQTDSIWFANGANYVANLHEDLKIRGYLMKRLKEQMISKVSISRKTNSITIDLHTARPGQVIGKKRRGDRISA